jgi:hypothetical protein
MGMILRRGGELELGQSRLSPDSSELGQSRLSPDLLHVPVGTFITAYGQANGATYAVPFTEAGLKCKY